MHGSRGAESAAGSSWGDGRNAVFVWVERVAGRGSLVAGVSLAAQVPRIARLTDGRFDDVAPVVVAGPRGLEVVWARRRGAAVQVLAAPLSVRPDPALGPARTLVAADRSLAGFTVLPPTGDGLELLLVREGPRRVTLEVVREGEEAQTLAAIPATALAGLEAIAIGPGEVDGAVVVSWTEIGGLRGQVERDPDGLWHAPRFASAEAGPPGVGSPDDGSAPRTTRPRPRQGRRHPRPYR
ncbi:MAG: hypothetical protein Kow0062_19100 [Acidobacteriota bacterium]